MRLRRSARRQLKAICGSHFAPRDDVDVDLLTLAANAGGV
jgi:hypothetical protein